MRSFLLLSFLCMAPIAVQAQSTDSLVIRMRDGSTMSIPLGDIDVVTFETEESSVKPDITDAKPLLIYPNPAADGARVTFNLATSQVVKLEIFGADGNLINKITERLTAGPAAINWNGLQSDGTPAPAGTYFFRVITREETLTGKLVRR